MYCFVWHGRHILCAQLTNYFVGEAFVCMADLGGSTLMLSEKADFFFSLPSFSPIQKEGITNYTLQRRHHFLGGSTALTGEHSRNRSSCSNPEVSGWLLDPGLGRSRDLSFAGKDRMKGWFLPALGHWVLFWVGTSKPGSSGYPKKSVAPAADGAFSSCWALQVFKVVSYWEG